MTREEAIKIINCYDIGFYDLSGEKIPADKLANAFDLAIEALSADAEDTQTEERARFVAKETELAHIEARLENAEKRLQGVCVANFVAEQLERLREMTDEERWEFFKRFFEVEGGDDE